MGCSRAEFRAWEFMLWLYSTAVQYLFIPTGALITVAFALVVTALGIKGAILEYQGSFSFDGTNEWKLEPAVIGAAIGVVLLIGLGLGMFALIEGLGTKRKRHMKENKNKLPAADRTFALNRRWSIKILSAIGIFAGLPILTIWMVFVAVNQCAIALKGLAWFFAGTFSLVGVDEMPDAWRPHPIELGIAATIMVVVGTLAFLASWFYQRKKHEDGCLAFAFSLRTIRPYTRSARDIMMDAAFDGTVAEVASMEDDSGDGQDFIDIH